MEVLDAILPLVHANAYWISYIIGTVSQETLIFLAMLSGAGDLPLWTVMLFGFLGAMTHDTVMYFVGKHYLGKPVGRLFNSVKGKGEWVDRLTKKAHDNILLLLFFSKFIYGVRLAALWYVSAREKNYWSYIRKDAPADIMALLIMLPLGWLAGKGFTILLTLFTGARYAVFAAVIIWISFLLFKKLINRRNKK